MKTTRHINSLILTVCLLFVTATSISAAAVSAPDNSPSTYTDFCNDYFLYHDLYTVYDKNDFVISDSFYSATISLYEENNIDAIYEYFPKEDSYEQVDERIKVAVIGNRAYSLYGKEMTQKIVKELKDLETFLPCSISSWVSL